MAGSRGGDEDDQPYTRHQRAPSTTSWSDLEQQGTYLLTSCLSRACRRVMGWEVFRLP